MVHGEYENNENTCTEYAEVNEDEDYNSNNRNLQNIDSTSSTQPLIMTNTLYDTQYSVTAPTPAERISVYEQNAIKSATALAGIVRNVKNVNQQSLKGAVVVVRELIGGLKSETCTFKNQNAVENAGNELVWKLQELAEICKSYGNIN
eukprot:Pgem_evm1s15031